RIFTPVREMVFAGHPTIGAAFVMLDEGIVPTDARRFVLEEKVGAVPIRVEPGDRPMIWLETPPIRDGKTYDRDAWARALGLDVNDLLDIAPQLLSAGNPTVYVAVKDVKTVDRASLNAHESKHLILEGNDPVCVFVFTPTPKGAYSR